MDLNHLAHHAGGSVNPEQFFTTSKIVSFPSRNFIHEDGCNIPEDEIQTYAVKFVRMVSNRLNNLYYK